MASVQGLIVDNIDFPKTFIRQALTLGGFSIQDAEFSTCGGGKHVIVWLQNSEPSPADTTPTPQPQLSAEHPQIVLVREHLTRLVQAEDARRADQAQAPGVANDTSASQPTLSTTNPFLTTTETSAKKERDEESEWEKPGERMGGI